MLKSVFIGTSYEEDCSALQVDDTEKSAPAIQEMHFTRVVVGVSLCTFPLNVTKRHHQRATSRFG